MDNNNFGSFGVVLNLTQHAGSTEQILEGLLEPTEHDGGKERIAALLTFSKEDILAGVFHERARKLANLAKMHCTMHREAMEYVAQEQEGEHYSAPSPIRSVMIGGLGALMGPLTRALREAGLRPVYSHSDRVSVDLPNGEKKSVFKHQFFYPAPAC